MKNFIKRTFTKAIAVAAAATIATGVLSGCNFVPSTNDEPVDAPVGQNITLKEQGDNDQTVSFTILGCTVNSQTNLATLGMRISNDTNVDKTVMFGESKDNGHVGVAVQLFSTKNPSGVNLDSSQFDDKLTWKDNKNLVNQSIAGNNTTTAGVSFKEGNIFFKPADGDEDWYKAEVTVSIGDSDGKVSSYTFTVTR